MPDGRLGGGGGSRGDSAAAGIYWAPTEFPGSLGRGGVGRPGEPGQGLPGGTVISSARHAGPGSPRSTAPGDTRPPPAAPTARPSPRQGRPPSGLRTPRGRRPPLHLWGPGTRGGWPLASGDERQGRRPGWRGRGAEGHRDGDGRVGDGSVHRCVGGQRHAVDGRTWGGQADGGRMEGRVDTAGLQVRGRAGQRTGGWLGGRARG